MGVKIVSYDRNALSLCFIGFCIPPGHFKMSEFFTVDRNVTKFLTYGHKEFPVLFWYQMFYMSPVRGKTPGAPEQKGGEDSDIVRPAPKASNTLEAEFPTLLEEPKNLLTSPKSVGILYN